MGYSNLDAFALALPFFVGVSKCALLDRNPVVGRALIMPQLFSIICRNSANSVVESCGPGEASG
jgi:hypothetical protein